MTTMALVAKTAKTADITPLSFQAAFADRTGDGTQLVRVDVLVDSQGVLVDPASRTGQTDLIARIGDVQANPGANTLLDRIKTLATAYGTTADSVTSDETANGASFSFVSMFKGIVSNTRVTAARLPTTLGQKAASGSLSTDQASNGVVATAYGALTDAATPDPSATGASKTFSSLLQGIAVNGFALLGRLPASLGAKTSALSLSTAPASDAVFPAPADQDPIFNHAAGVKVSITTSVSLITPPAGCKYIRVSCDSDVLLNTSGVAAVDDGTTIRVVANSPEVIPVVPGTAVFALSLSGAAAVVRAMPMKVR